MKNVELREGTMRKGGRNLPRDINDERPSGSRPPQPGGTNPIGALSPSDKQYFVSSKKEQFSAEMKKINEKMGKRLIDEGKVIKIVGMLGPIRIGVIYYLPGGHNNYLYYNPDKLGIFTEVNKVVKGLHWMGIICNTYKSPCQEISDFDNFKTFDEAKEYIEGFFPNDVKYHISWVKEGER